MGDKFNYEVRTFGRKISTSQKIKDAYISLNSSGDGDSGLTFPSFDNLCVTTLVEVLPRELRCIEGKTGNLVRKRRTKKPQ